MEPEKLLFASIMSTYPDDSSVPENLYQQVLSGGIWVFSLRFLQQILSVGKILILTYFLAPYDFGIFGISLLAMETLNLLTQTGFHAALIQNQQDIKTYLNCAWSAGLVRAVVLSGTLCLCAPSIVGFFDSKGTLAPHDILEPSSFVTQLTDPTNIPGQYIFGQFSIDAQKQVKNTDESGIVTDSLLEVLASEINGLIRNPNFYDNHVFANVAFSGYTQSLIDQPERRSGTSRFHRRILEESFSDAILPATLDRDTAILVLQILSFSLLLAGLQNIGTVYFIKDLKFNRVFWIQFGGTLTDVTVSIIVAILEKNIWALVWGKLAGATVTLCLSYLIHPYRPRFHLDWKKVSSLWRYGKWILGSTLVGFLMLKANDLFIGKLLGPAMLGIYQLAYRISFMPSKEITAVVSQVTFPSYSRIQHDLPRLKEAYLRVLRTTTFFAFPVTGLVWFLAADFSRLLLPDHWQAVVPIIQLLAILGLMSAVFSNTGPLLKAVGKHKYAFYWMLLRLAMTSGLVYPLTTNYGLQGACWAILIPAIAIKFLVVPILVRIARFTYSEFLKQILPSIACTSLIVVLLYMLRSCIVYTTQSGISLPVFFLLLILSILLYVLVSLKYNSRVIKEMREVFLVLFKNSDVKATPDCKG
jgi:O-antigen/teichoic acid export membrane protein